MPILQLTVVNLQAATSPISGVLGDKYDRTHIVAFGCFLWGVMTAVIGFSTSLHQARYASIPHISLLCLLLMQHTMVMWYHNLVLHVLLSYSIKICKTCQASKLCTGDAVYRQVQQNWYQHVANVCRPWYHVPSTG